MIHTAQEQNQQYSIKNEETETSAKKYLDRYVNVLVPPPREIKFQYFKRTKENIEAQHLRETNGNNEAMESDDRGETSDERNMSCWPPPVGIVMVSVIQILCFVINKHVPRDRKGSTTTDVLTDIFEFNPCKREQIWRYLTYMFIHFGKDHLGVNVVIQIVLGFALECANGSWRVLSIYFAGGIAGALLSLIMEPSVYLIGASGGTYALISAHIFSIVLNWKLRKRFSKPLFIIDLVIVAIDWGRVLIERAQGHLNDEISYCVHIGGVVIGIFLGIWVLKVIKRTKAVKYLCWSCMGFYIFSLSASILLIVFWKDHFC